MQQEAPTQPARYRQLPGVLGIVARVMLSAMPVAGVLYILDVAGYLGKSFFGEQYFGLMFALSLTAGFLIVPATKETSRSRFPWYDAVFAILSLISGGYIVVFYPSAVYTLGIIMPDRVILGGILILAAIELCRRLYGWPLVTLGVVFLLYARFTYLVPGVLSGPGISWERLATSLYLHPSAILGVPSRVVFTIVLAFVLFGQVMFATGGGRSITDLALAMMGRFRGGPAKVAVVASSMFGTLSGSATANVLTTGQVTIPMMKETGYKPAVAGAIEAVASSGGQIMPPVMGSSAFLIAEFLEIPYPKVVIAALVPAILYYLAVFIQVDLEAAKSGIKGLPAHLLPPFKKVLTMGWVYIIPIVVLIYCLFILYLSPAKSALLSAACFFVVGAFRKETRLTPRSLMACLENTGRLTMEIGIIVAIAGILIGIVGITGVGITLSQVLVAISGGNIWVLLVLAAVASTILGMGMPVTATYIVLVILTAPALIQLGVLPLAAHLFVFYFGVLSFITPPVCVAVYPAAILAGSDVMRTGLQAVKIGIVAYIVPFLFAINQALLLMGSIGNIILTVSTSVLGFAFLAITIQGYLFRKLALMSRFLLGAGAVLLLWHNWVGNIIGFGLIIVSLLWEWRASRAIRGGQDCPSAASPGGNSL